MGWYDVFSRFYDASLEPLYREARLAAVESLRLSPGLRVLDAPCGTGQSLLVLCPPLQPEGELLGVDLSQGMLRRAKEKVAAASLRGVQLAQADLRSYRVPDGKKVDRLHVFLGLSTLEDFEAVFASLWESLSPGGRCVVVDVHSERLSLQGRMVNWMAQADIRRRTWEPLEQRAQNFERRALPSLPKHGGQLYLACGDKPAG